VLYALATTALWASEAFTISPICPSRCTALDSARRIFSLTLLVFGAAAAIGNMLGGLLADRLGATPTAAIGLAGMATALILLSAALKFAPPDDARYAVLLNGVLLGPFSRMAFYPRRSPASTATIRGLDDRPVAQRSSCISALPIGGAVAALVPVGARPTDLGWVGRLQRRGGRCRAFAARTAGNG